MLIYCLVGGVAMLASGLTLFSGFGLGTILTPVFVLFFPVEVAVAMTALVHFANNLFKLAMFWRAADRRVALAFGLPAMAASFAGAALLVWLAGFPPLGSWELGGEVYRVEVVKLTVAVLMAAFAVMDLVPGLKPKGVDPKWLPLGGVLSGFFGGLSGHQGAFRSGFLTKTGLSKEAFVATGVLIACMVDATRLLVYARLIATPEVADNAPIIVVATLAAFAGAFIARRLLTKMTIEAVHTLVAVMLFVLAALLGAGII